jgi:LytS/YehU family sensor histidine kinase
MKLSEILRYMLYDSNSNFVPLDKEIKYLQGFIELQQLRLRETEFVQFIIEGSTIDKTIAPMLLIPFIENAFKHGSKKPDVPGIIIRLTTDTDKILFEIKNYISINALLNKDSATGIGMKNVERRLELLYTNKHKLEKIEKDNMYIIKLELDLL